MLQSDVFFFEFCAHCLLSLHSILCMFQFYCTQHCNSVRTTCSIKGYIHTYLLTYLNYGTAYSSTLFILVHLVASAVRCAGLTSVLSSWWINSSPTSITVLLFRRSADAGVGLVQRPARGSSCPCLAVSIFPSLYTDHCRLLLACTQVCLSCFGK